jgi:hypothetical protein
MNKGKIQQENKMILNSFRMNLEHEGKGRSRYNSSGKSQHIPFINRQYI